jgi:very-short-patch-repair endonuclease
MYSNGTNQCSKQQKYLHNILGGKLNYPIGKSSLDIAFPDEKIYIEYDGSGHDLSVKLGRVTQQEFLDKEKRRNYALLKRGWKEIRIVSKDDKLPTSYKIKQMFDEAINYLNEGHHWIKFIINDNIIQSSVFNKYYNYGELKRI